ncbi:restriction modification system DNA specificity domain [Desulfurispirillum indicum S5]|uniref:Restriction modification system DNA specificity domain n=1 Tax=Desulfurispirillum indicum (strain ATCC BAA-1389 / DSM 22839 / S5) TaxID=653733 RepID=E6W0U0_DESIS|nr:restriction endonuclease subunit S [Desulfurispirillum indicum]ADU66435.1 restriction modification system DNA specificity domain [Desulfurispirillum indicum S5]
MRKVPISSIADVTAGQGAPKPDEFSDSGIPFVRAGSLEDLLAGKSESDLELVPAQTAKKRKLKLYPKGSILFAKSGMSATKDRIYVLQNPAHVVSHLAILTPKDNVYRDYLRLALKQFPPSSLIKDPAYPAIGLGEIQSYEIPVPEEIDDQKRIAHLLGKVEGLIARRKQHLQQLDDLLKSVFLEMFGDPVRNEKGWEKDRIGRSTKVQGGFAFKSKDLVTKGNVRLVKIANVHFENLIWDDVTFVPNHFIEDYIRFALSEGDLLIALTRPIIKSLDVVKTATVREADLPCLLNQRVARFVFDKAAINKRFFLQYCYTSFFKNTVDKLCPPGLQPNISTNQIEDIPIYYPPIDLQNQFATIVEKVEGLKSHYQQSLTDLESLYGALSQKAFKGELDLSRVALPAEGPEIAEEEKMVIEEIQPMEPLFELPAPEELALLQTAEGRKSLLGEWLNVWLAQLGDAPFAAQAFMDAARQRLWELAEDDAPDWGVAEYDELKTQVFEALEQGRLTQGYDDVHNRVQLKKAIP